MNIEWKEINPEYVVSSDGQVGSRMKGGLKILRQALDTRGYFRVILFSGGIARTRRVHQLVAESFLGPRPTPKHEVNHKNGVRSDNRSHNLEWVTRSENLHHRYDVLKHGAPRGEAHGRARLTEAQVHEIRSRAAAGESQQSVADSLGVAQTTVSMIVLRKTWSQLSGVIEMRRSLADEAGVE